MRAINRRRYFNSVDSGYDASDVDSVESDYTILMQSNADAAKADILTKSSMKPIYIAGVIAVIGIFALIKVSHENNKKI